MALRCGRGRLRVSPLSITHGTERGVVLTDVLVDLDPDGAAVTLKVRAASCSAGGDVGHDRPGGKREQRVEYKCELGTHPEWAEFQVPQSKMTVSPALTGARTFVGVFSID
jgi:hypothetical protein